MLKSVGEGSDTLFWHNIWVGEIPFKEKYNRLFRISLDQEAVIVDMGSWNQGKWEWEWRWRRNLFVWENELLQELINELQGISLKKGQIPTKDNLMKRGMNGQGNEKCVLCDLEAESVEHLFFKCNVSWSIWASCYDWWDLKVAVHTMWCIWIWRNQKIFKDGADTKEQVVELIKFRSFYWCKTALCLDLVQDKWRSKPTEGYMRMQQQV
ncbi:hypothetical protein SLEP1_g56569 [Rubroshorea leprosula]|uniref:Reverse transcriptase zinc-binding domain-containing protein n=1 Tax=Rubroshorea leprosula TaxID=152421 RepID=A0AAV5MN28_9ROSI|nr:hypothetical protein SLEP1_g56569 [Rubroshorea leprosula]